MATERYYTCECCDRSYPGSLFDALVNFSMGNPICSDCGSQRALHLVFEFGLGAGYRHCKVLAAFLPRERCSWKVRNGGKVTFYPFLVIVETDDGDQSCWLPYWHVAESKRKPRKTKYGQWAPFLNQSEFKSLLKQARKAGYHLGG